jgi:hypothetical protein
VIGRGLCRRSSPFGCRTPNHPQRPRWGNVAPRYITRVRGRRPCNVPRYPVRCSDTEPATRHDRHPPSGRRRRPRTHDPLRVAPRSRRRDRTESCLPLSPRRAGAPRRYVHRTGWRRHRRTRCVAEGRIRSAGSGVAVPPEPRRAPGQPSCAGLVMRFAGPVNNRATGNRPDAYLPAPPVDGTGTGNARATVAPASTARREAR